MSRHSSPVSEERVVLNAGCGRPGPGALHAWFAAPHWREIRVDIDAAAAPDIIASLTDLSAVPDASVDAVWASHVLEHMHDHEVPQALREVLRVLRPDGFALVTSPDIVRVAQEVVLGRLEDVLYVSSAGPVRALDILYGLGSAVAAGQPGMAHRTAFSADRLGRLLLEAGFHEARVGAGSHYDLWGLALASPASARRLPFGDEPAQSAA